MKQLELTTGLLQQFKSCAETLIFEGFATNADSVTIYNDGDNYALVADVKGAVKLCLKTDSASFVEDILQLLSGKQVEFSGVDPFVTELLRARYNFLWETNTYLYAWNGKPLSYKCKQQIEAIEPQFAQKVSDGTHYHAPIADIVECLVRHPSAAIYLNGEPVCWCLLHLDKTLGMLYTEPQHRRKGYALEVMTALTNKVIAQGDVPYAYIVVDNVPSQNLAAKYNLERVKRADYFMINID